MIIKVRLFFLISTIWLLKQNSVTAQDSSSILIYSELHSKLSDRLGFWDYSNSGGRLIPDKNQLISGIKTNYNSPLIFKSRLRLYSEVFYNTENVFTFQEYGIEIKNDWFKLGYGTENQDIGLIRHTISTGSFVESGNAKPFEKLYFSTNGFIPLFILGKYSDWFLINGYISHTEFKSRAIKNEMLHFKSLYGHALNPLPVSIYGGITHMAFWGGESATFGNLASGWDTFKKIFWALGGGEVGPDAETAYTLGNHIGVFDFGTLLKFEKLTIDIYRTFLIEDRDGLNFKNLWEGAFGSELSIKQSKWIKKINYEYIYTKRQSGSVPPSTDNSRGGPGGWDNYYNHYLYTDGWTNDGFTIGNPLMSSSRLNGLGLLAVSNNRIVAHHIGIESNVSSTIQSIIKITYSRNYGNYIERNYAIENDREYDFDGGLRQLSFGWFINQTIHYKYPVNVEYGAFYDNGELYKNQLSFKFKVQISI
ncbi:hypothetical protein EP331_00715 [bacterium]|nr:MAG: hypothetical protein EP331_00715 [bacterium]